MDRGNLVAEICRIQDLPEDIRNKLESSPGTVFPYADRLITLISGKVYSFPDDEDGRTVAGAVEARQAAVSQQPASAADIYHRILTDSHYQPLPSVIRQYGIRPDRKRCVAVFRACSSLDTDLRTAILSMAPVEKEDAVILLDDQTAAYIKDLEGQTTDDMAEFTEAVIGTLETEGILDIRAGIGGESHKLDDLRDSFSEGRKALSSACDIICRTGFMSTHGRCWNGLSIPFRQTGKKRSEALFTGTAPKRPCRMKCLKPYVSSSATI